MANPESRYPGELEQKAAPSLTCPRCGITSYSLQDVEHGYCAKCDVFLKELYAMTLAGPDRSVDPEHAEEVNHARRLGALYLRQYADGRFVLVEPAAFNYGYLKLCSSDDPLTGIDDVWMYDPFHYAIQAAHVWVPVLHAEPFGWIRHPSSGRRRPYGNPANEYVRR